MVQLLSTLNNKVTILTGGKQTSLISASMVSDKKPGPLPCEFTLYSLAVTRIQCFLVVSFLNLTLRLQELRK